MLHKTSVYKFFQISRNQFQILGTRRVKRSKFHTEDPHLWSAAPVDTHYSVEGSHFKCLCWKYKTSLRKIYSPGRPDVRDWWASVL